MTDSPRGRLRGVLPRGVSPHRILVTRNLNAQCAQVLWARTSIVIETYTGPKAKSTARRVAQTIERSMRP